MKHRKSNRLKTYDYSQNGIYFVTICTKDKKCYFGKIVNNEIVLNDFGKIIKKQWLWLQDQYDYVYLDEFIIMPNHFHGILEIRSDRSRPVTTVNAQAHQKIKPLSQLIGAFKTRSSKYIHKQGLDDFQWQRSFYDHIIRKEESLNKIREYIMINPQEWNKDKNNPLT